MPATTEGSAIASRVPSRKANYIRNGALSGDNFLLHRCDYISFNQWSDEMVNVEDVLLLSDISSGGIDDSSSGLGMNSLAMLRGDAL